jgi:catalase
MILWNGTTGAAAGEAGNAFETIPPNEAEEIDELSKLATELQDRRRDNDPSQEGMLLRGVHPKSHGCVRAEFTVDEDIDARRRVGLFATPGKTFEAWIRYSNAAVLREDDLKAADPTKPDERKNGSRGMAIKVLDVEGRNVE